jgi:Niemann-Pick C1 protein
MAIGLLVDYVMHVALQYYELAKSSRNEKAKEVLKMMGASVLLGGLSTFLGILPLILSKVYFVNTFFVAFICVVTLGLGHGLILLPVILSLLGPT